MRPSTHAATASHNARWHQFIKELASRKIRAFEGTIDPTGTYFDRIYQSNRSLAESIASDYRDRFLFELIQNAYDAQHIGTREGRIEVTFDERYGTHGTLFVANTGSPFGEKNVESLCDIGLSDKPLGESIGNKGLGFRSVIQITDSPEIYSQDVTAPGTDSFSGFCFRFAEPQDYATLITNPTHLELAKRDLPLFRLPMPLEDQSAAIRAYAMDGFSTVVALPLRDAECSAAVRRELDHLRTQRVPVLLFLDRVSSLFIQVIGGSGKAEMEFRLTRTREDCRGLALDLSRVHLGTAGQFLVARKSIPETTMKAAIAAGVSHRELNDYWRTWSGDGEVGVAVRLDSVVEVPRLYTFLPLGEQAAAPFQGYLNGTFSPSSSREHLDSGIRLNSVLLREAAALTAKAISHLVTGPAGSAGRWLAIEERAAAVVDLLSWSKVDSLGISEQLGATLAQRLADDLDVRSVDQAPVVPCLQSASGSRTVGWCSPASARRWPSELSMFSAEVAAEFADETRLWPIWPSLGCRIDRLEEFLRVYSGGPAGPPRAEERAHLVSLVARRLAERRTPPKTKWQDFYRELPHFMGRDATHLAGRPVLLGEDNQVHLAMSSGPPAATASRPTGRRSGRVTTAIFSPPDPRRTSSDEDFDVDPPPKLSSRFAFLSGTLSWHGDLAPARVYLEEHKLVGEFDRETVLTHLSRTLQDEKSRRVLRSGLRWAFQLWRQPRAHGRPFRLQAQHVFYVPTLGNTYVDARETVFSADWPADTSGALLQEFLSAAPPGLPDLKRLADRRLAAPRHPAFGGKLIDDWVLFLAELGVNKGLTPELGRTRTKRYSGYQLSGFSFAEDYGVPPRFIEAWQHDISTQDPDLLSFSQQADYVIEGRPSWLPGQCDVDSFSFACKVLYAQLILEWLSTDPNVQWGITVHHSWFNHADRRTWPTPLKSFLRSAHWLPVDGSKGSSVALRPGDVWVNRIRGERFEPYLPRPPHTLRRYLEQVPEELLRALAEHAGLRIFNDPSGLPAQLEFLVRQYSNEGFDHYYDRRLINFYNRTWHRLLRSVGNSEHEVGPESAPAVVLARRGLALDRVDMFDQAGDDDCQLYVCDTERDGDQSVMEASGRSFFFLRDADAQEVGELFDRLYGARVRRLSGVTYELRADGRDIRDCPAVPVLDVCPHLRAMVAIAMEALSGTEGQRLPADRTTILARLERLGTVKARRISFVIDGIDVSTGKEKSGAFHFKFEDGQPIVAIQSSGDWTWELVDWSIPAMCEALGHRALAPHLRLLAAHLRLEGPLAGATSKPFEDVERFSRVLQLPASASGAARTALSAGMERHLPWIAAVLHVVIGPSGVEELSQHGDDVLKEPGLLENTLSRLLSNSPVSASELFAVCRTALEARDFREGLELDFQRFNTSLVALGLEPETYPDLHKSRLETFLVDKGVEITDCLRASCAEQLNRMQPAKGYAARRDSIRHLKADPSWLPLFVEPPEDTLIEHVNLWLADGGSPPLGSTGGGLEPLDQVRDHNRRFVRDFAKRAIPVVRAWRARFQPGHPVAMAAEVGRPDLRKRLDDIGVLDFSKLDDLVTMRWLQVLGVWPSGMELSLDLAKLGLSEADLKAEDKKAREAQEAIEREKRSIPFNGRLVDPIGADLSVLSEELREGMPSSVLTKALRSTPKLADAERSPSSNRTSSKGRRGRGWGRPVPEKTELVGQLGELAVYHWLCRILRNQDIDSAWRSRNGTVITGREGDDSLGYDFEVGYRNQIWQIEVKASLEDPQSFRMGETEVVAARMAAQPRSGVQYKIAYVSNVADTSKMTIEMLPNPATEEGTRVLQLRGEGIRYGFRRL